MISQIRPSLVPVGVLVPGLVHHPQVHGSIFDNQLISVPSSCPSFLSYPYLPIFVASIPTKRFGPGIVVLTNMAISRCRMAPWSYDAEGQRMEHATRASRRKGLEQLCGDPPPGATPTTMPDDVLLFT